MLLDNAKTPQISSNFEAFPQIFYSDSSGSIKVAIQILSGCISTINEFYCVSRVSRRFRALAQHPDVIRTLFSRSIFALWPRRYPMPASCAQGRVVLRLTGLSRDQTVQLIFSEAARDLHHHVENFVSFSFNEQGDVKVAERPYLYLEDIAEDTIAFLRKYAKNVTDLKVVFKCKDFFIGDPTLDRLVTHVQGISELYLGDYSDNACSWGERITDNLDGITDAGLENVGCLKGLRSLTLRARCNRISLDTFERLGACTRLETLIVSMPHRTCKLYDHVEETITLNDDDMQKVTAIYPFRKMGNPEREELTPRTRGDSDSPSFPNLSVLKTLNIFKLPYQKHASWCLLKKDKKFTIDRPEKIVEIGLKNDELVQIGRLTSLTELSVYLYKNSSPALSALSGLQKLQTFTMHNASSSCYWFLKDDALFQSLARVTSLTSLYLERIHGTKDESMKLMMTSLTGLQRLSFWDVDFSSAGLSYIALNPSLRHLDISSMNYKNSDMDARDSKIRLKAAKEIVTGLVRCPKLETLNLGLSELHLKPESAENQELIDLLEPAPFLRSITFRFLWQSDPILVMDKGYRRNQEGKFMVEWLKPSRENGP